MGSPNQAQAFGYRPIEFDKYITPDGETYNFTNAIDRFLISSTGRGMPSINYRTERGPFQDGLTPLGFVLDGARFITYTFRLNADCREEYWDERAALLDSLRPNRQAVGQIQPGVLRKILPDGSVRDIQVFIDFGPQFISNSDRWDEWSITETLRFVAFDPTFFDPTRQTVTLTLPSDDDDIIFPFDFTFIFTQTVLVETDTITYTGTWKTFPTITIQGPIRNPVIGNLSTGDSIALDYTVPAGRTVTIDLSFGNKTVTDDLGTNLIGTVTTESDLANFAIVPDPTAPNGVNSIGVTGSLIVAGQTSVTLSYFTRFIGL